MKEINQNDHVYSFYLYKLVKERKKQRRESNDIE